MMFSSTTFRLAARNAWRRRSRTALTIGMVVFGVALLLLSMTWIRGAMSTALALSASMGGHVRVVTPKYAEREDLNPLEEHLAITQELLAALRAQKGVQGVEPRIITGVTLSVGDEIGESFALLIGAGESYFRERLQAKDKLIDGQWFSGKPDEVLLGATVAKDTGAKVGDEMVMLGVTQDGSLSPIKCTVAGIVHMSTMADQQVFVALEKAQWLADIDDGATELLIFGESHQTAVSLAAALRQLPEVATYRVEAWSEREPMKSMSAQVSSMQSIIIGVLVLLVALGIWNTMMMSVLERTHEIGVLRALGLSRLGAVGLFFGEALTIGLAGGILGVAVGAWPSWLLQKHGIHIGEKTASSTDLPLAATIYGDLTLESMILALFLGVFMAVLGSVLPAIRAASIQPIVAMRAGR